MGNCLKRTGSDTNFKESDSLHITSKEKLLNTGSNEPPYNAIKTDMKSESLKTTESQKPLVSEDLENQEEHKKEEHKEIEIEANELIAIFIASIKTSKLRR